MALGIHADFLSRLSLDIEDTSGDPEGVDDENDWLGSWQILLEAWHSMALIGCDMDRLL